MALWPLLLPGREQAGESRARGKLVQRPEGPALEAPDAQEVALEGDKDTLAVLMDARLAGRDLQVRGRRASSGRFEILPFTTRGAVLVHEGGKLYTVSYWCQVCAIRTYTPGKCMCCQEETELSLQEFNP